MIREKKVLCVITARAGSKGLPCKNFRNLLGRPLFMWSVLAALESQHTDTIVLSTNCEECEKIFIDFIKKEVNDKDRERMIFIQRPEEYATDTSKNEEALIHSLNFCEERYGLSHDIVCNLQPTSPCRFGELIDESIEQYYLDGHDSLLTAIKDTPFIWQKIDGKWVYNVDKNDCCDRKMRQEFEESEFIYKDCGNLYLTDSRILLDRECRIGYNPCIFEVRGLNGLQIDTEYDFKLIENMAKAMNTGSLI